ncbi:MAG: FtsX-like permease family protein, partial [Acidobacteria bacterium]|nr:FtsX-like permease family protein [Acidobacteriota bacterium]
KDINLTGDGNPERVAGLATYGAFGDVLGIRPRLGRWFTEDEDKPGKDRVILISERLSERRGWHIGESIEVNGEKRTIVGVLPDFLGLAKGTDAVIPMAPVLEREGHGDHRVFALARMRRGVSTGEALDEMLRICTQLETEFPKPNRGWRVRLQSIRDWLVDSRTRETYNLLLAAAGLLLLVACVNVANLLLARAAAREKEIGIRLAAGANRARLTRQMVTESLVIAVIGGAAGLALVGVAVRLLLPGGATIDFDVVAFSAGATMATGLLFGLAPALKVRDGRALPGPRRTPVRQLLIGSQVAVAMVLVTGALLLVQTLVRMLDADLGFQKKNLYVAKFSPSPKRYDTGEKAHNLYTSILREVRAIPGVESAGITSEIPLGSMTTEMRMIAEENGARFQTDAVRSNWRIVTDGYLQTLGVRLLRGRFWHDGEDPRLLPVVINAELARRLWPAGEDPVGRSIRLGNGRSVYVIGLVGDVRQIAVEERSPTNTLYFPSDLLVWETMTLTVRTRVAPLSIAPAVEAAVRRVDPAQPLFGVRTMEEHLAESAAGQRMRALLLTVYAGMALLLGAVGVAGVTGYAVARRRKEFAIRMALGATPVRVMGEVTGIQMMVCGAGLAAGVVGAWVLRTKIESMLYGVQPGSLGTFASSASVLALVTLLACLLPALRVTRIQPAAALRND